MKIAKISPGYSGSRFPGNALQLVKTTSHHDNPLRLIETMTAINDQRKRAMARKVVAAVGGDLRGKTIAVLGLTFKPNTDDMRETPSLSIIQALQDAGATIRGYDPEGMGAAKGLLDTVTYTKDVYDCATGVDALVIVTEWDAFRALDFPRLKTVMTAPVLVDLRNVYKAGDVPRHGFAYASVGRGAEQAGPNMSEAAE